ncbi:penicillin-insensitive murein endopeptidase [Paraliomyxa miuraensis]|uniref:penicillin-insensitive murein endopeptidase n=1 Tax=Paraliomyxa miuraensis TaxID=376150 RepID=UPI0022599822|nr:penicillin-insensitive murein endopeptidase [Paraliomyxa miuraensis]MCX4243740.1 penicillin-insensitive murein endopeptidase [Paraliomyxa miuraensis]
MQRPRAARALRLALIACMGLGFGGAVPRAAHAWAPPPDEEGSEDAGGEGTEGGPKWIKHRVVPRETLDTIAIRYGVTRDQLVRWNKKKLGERKWIYAGQTLKVHATLQPPPREKIEYIVEKGDTWGKIADHFGVPMSDLRAWNPKVPKKFKAGAKLKVYTDPKAPPPTVAGGEAGTEALADLPAVRKGGMGVGKPNRGYLVNAVQLPQSEMVRILDPDKVWGTSHTIEHLQEAIAMFRRDTGYDEPLTISSISLRKGGKFGPHSSHRTGRDVDIRLPRKPGAPKGEAPSSIDWRNTWKLVEALVATGEVEYIFVSWSRQKYLYRAAQSAGANTELLEKMIQYPRKSDTNKGVVRHSPGHTVHLHVRFTCTPGNSRCESY